MTATSENMLEAALSYAARGWPVIPLHTPVIRKDQTTKCTCNKDDCPAIGKHPRTVKGLKAATIDTDQIRKWWSMWPMANIGVITGKNSTDKYLVAIDIDPKHNGTESWSSITETHPKLPDTPEAITGSGGKHILFYSDVLIKNSVSVVAEGVDVRGEGGYIVVAPSLHASGKRYMWELSSDPAEVPVAPLPDWLFAMAAPKRGSPKPLPVDENGKILEGKRNDTLFSFGRTMRAKNAEHSVILAALLQMNEAQCDPPLDPKAVEIIAHQVATVPAGMSTEVKDKIKKAEDQQKAQKEKVDQAKKSAKEAEKRARAEAMKLSVDESRRSLQMVSYEFLAGSEKMEDPADVAAREAAKAAEEAARAAAIREAEESATQALDAQESVDAGSELSAEATAVNQLPSGQPVPDHSNGQNVSSNGSGGSGGDSGGWSGGGEFFSLSRGDSVELATLILREIRGKSSVPIVYDRAEFWYYNQHIGIWSLIERTIFSKRISLYAGSLIGDKPLHLSGGAINEAIKLASDYAHRRDFFNEAPTGILFKNGFVIVKNGVAELLPHSPEHRALYRFEFDYNPLCKPIAWFEFLEQVFTLPTESTLPEKALAEAKKDRADRIAFLQEHAGASLMGEATKYGVCAVLYGESASNGKSVYLEVIKSIFPTGSVTSVSPHDWTNRFFLAELAGVRLNVVDELAAKEIAESESFKSIATGGHIMVHRKNGRPFNLIPNSGHLFACNTLPGTRDQTDGFWRRFAVIPFERKFEEKDREIGLAARLISTDMAGIAIWAIQGLARLQQKGMYTTPASATAAKAAWQLESDQVRQWMNECTIDEGVKVRDESKYAGRMTASGAYTSYLYWVKVTSHGVGLSQQKFWKRLNKACESERKDTGVLYLRRIDDAWNGIRRDESTKYQPRA